MLNGLYGYLFGGEESTQKENVGVDESQLKCKEKKDWVLIEQTQSGRSSPVLVPDHELQEIDNLSTVSSIPASKADPSKLRKEEDKRAVKAMVQQRQYLAQKLFEEPKSTNPSTPPPSPPKPEKPLLSKVQASNLTAAQLKRATKSEQVQNESKTKSRSKKHCKSQACRSNDRKVNNIN